MKFVFVTLFPEQIEAAAGHSVLKRALDTGIIARTRASLRWNVSTRETFPWTGIIRWTTRLLGAAWGWC